MIVIMMMIRIIMEMIIMNSNDNNYDYDDDDDDNINSGSNSSSSGSGSGNSGGGGTGEREERGVLQLRILTRRQWTINVCVNDIHVYLRETGPPFLFTEEGCRNSCPPTQSNYSPLEALPLLGHCPILF